jgi:hypothetical protein
MKNNLEEHFNSTTNELSNCPKIKLEYFNFKLGTFNTDSLNSNFTEFTNVILPQEEQILLNLGMHTGFFWHCDDWSLQGCVNIQHIENVFTMQSNKVKIYNEEIDSFTLQILKDAYYFDTFEKHFSWDNATILYLSKEMTYPEIYFLDRFSVFPLNLSIGEYLKYAFLCKGIVYWQFFFAPPEIVEQKREYLKERLHFLQANFPNEDYSILIQKLN